MDFFEKRGDAPYSKTKLTDVLTMYYVGALVTGSLHIISESPHIIRTNQSSA